MIVITERALLRKAKLTFAATCLLSSFAFMVIVLPLATDPNRDEAATEFSVHLAGFDGLLLPPPVLVTNATTIAGGPTTTTTTTTTTVVVSPVFRLNVRADNPRRVLKPWCYYDTGQGGEVVVSCSGVALAWGRVPCFCVRRGSPAVFSVTAWGRGVGLSLDVRRRLAEDYWNVTGAAQVTVQMTMPTQRRDPRGWRSGSRVHLFHLSLN